MKKIWPILVIIVLLAAWLSATWYTGTLIETRTGNAIARMNAAWADDSTPGGVPQIKQISYQRGLLSSQARLGISLGLRPGQPLAEYDVTFSHGPFPLAALRRGNLAPLMLQAHAQVLAASGPLKMMAGALMDGKPPLVMDMDCGYGNHCTGSGSVPPIDVDLVPFVQNTKVAFGGARMRFDFDCQSDTRYKVNGEVQLLPFSIGGQNLGSGQITVTADAQSGTEVISWQTDQGASKLTIALAATEPMSLFETSFKPEDLPKLIKTASAKLELSKPMVVDLAARALNLTKGIDLNGARQQVGAQLDAMLTNSPDAEKFVHVQGDLLVSDWQYADGKLTINGQENPEVLAQIKRGYLTQLHAREQAAGNAAAQPPGDNGSVASSTPPASAPDGAASGQ
jgi:uncharacterized protein YdgA (DUF945 family)